MAASNVTILTYGAQAATAKYPTPSDPKEVPRRMVVAQGSSDSLDISAFTQLRLDITMALSKGSSRYLDVWIEMAPASTGPWTEAYHKRFIEQPVPNGTWPAGGVEKVRVAALDNFIRVRFYAEAMSNTDSGDPGLSLGVTGTALP